MSRWIYFVGVLFALCTLFASAQRYWNPGPQRRSAKLPVAVASSLTCSSPYRHDFTDGTAHYVSRSVFCSCFASLKTSTLFWTKRKKLPLCNRIPPVIHLGDYCRLQLSQRRVRGWDALVRTHHAVFCAGEQFLQCSPLSERALRWLKGCWPRPLVLLVWVVLLMEGSVEHWWSDTGRQNRSTQRGTCPSATVSTTSLSRTGPESKPYLLGAVSSCHLSENTR
jgi:hypothetical protein